MVIRPTDRVAAVLARDERLLEVFISLAPTFEKLRNPAMRKIMARLVTVEQAARVAGVDLELLLERLNAAAEGRAVEVSERRAAQVPEGGILEGAESRAAEVAQGRPAVTDSPAATPSDAPAPERPATIPAALAAIPEASIVDIDVRPDLRRGEEPFSKIMAARRQVPPGGALRVRATFEPVPLYAVLGKQGFEHWTESFADDDWRVWFYTTAADFAVAEAAGAAQAGEQAQDGGTGSDDANPEEDVVILDVRGLEPPEPMLRTFEALERLPPGKTLVQLNVRVPQFLLPQLAARGFAYEIREQSRELVRIFIRHVADHE